MRKQALTFHDVREFLHPLQGLTHLVQVRERLGPWETIAAFNVEEIAKRYADECRASSNTTWRVEYRVKEIGK